MSTTQEMAQIMERVGKCLNSDGHIYVLLDFIPVEEQLPEPYRVVCVLCENGESSRAQRTPHHIVNDKYEIGSWFDASNRAARPILLSVTHWAEIPQVSDAS